MKLNAGDIHLVTYCVDHDKYEPSPLSTWINTDTNLYFDRKKHSGDTWLILSAFSTREEAIAEVERLESEVEDS